MRGGTEGCAVEVGWERGSLGGSRASQDRQSRSEPTDRVEGTRVNPLWTVGSDGGAYVGSKNCRQIEGGSLGWKARLYRQTVSCALRERSANRTRTSKQADRPTRGGTQKQTQSGVVVAQLACNREQKQQARQEARRLSAGAIMWSRKETARSSRTWRSCRTPTSAATSCSCAGCGCRYQRTRAADGRCDV